MLPHVVRYNAADPNAARGYAELARRAGLAGDDPAEAIAALVDRMLRAGAMPRTRAEAAT